MGKADANHVLALEQARTVVLADKERSDSLNS
jgi:hypothetical protein